MMIIFKVMRGWVFGVLRGWVCKVQKYLRFYVGKHYNILGFIIIRFTCIGGHSFRRKRGSVMLFDC